VPSVILNRRAAAHASGPRFQWWWLVWVAAGVCTFLCGAVLGVVSSGLSGPGGGWFSQILSPAFGGRERVIILAVGVDKSSDRGLADTILVLAVSPRTGELSALSIPRDSRVQVPGVGIRRINSSHAVGGMPLTIETVEVLLGLPTDRYIRVDVPGLVKLVDAIGGVDIEVEKRMRYRDRSQNLSIDLQPGWQHLDGTQAMGYVRFRHDAAGDLGRMERQRHFLRAVLRQLTGPTNVSRLPQLARAFVETVGTNLTAKELLALKRMVEQAGPEGIRAETLPGEPKMVRGQSMIELDGERVEQTVDRVLRGLGLSVEVLNGTGISGLGARVAAELEEAGCEITAVGNAKQKSDVTIVISRRPGSRRAERVAEWIGMGVISVEPEGDNPADVTVIIGRDFSRQAGQAS